MKNFCIYTWFIGLTGFGSGTFFWLLFSLLHSGKANQWDPLSVYWWPFLIMLCVFVLGPFGCIIAESYINDKTKSFDDDDFLKRDFDRRLGLK